MSTMIIRKYIGLFALLCSIFLVILPTQAHAQTMDVKTTIAVFVREGCAHCKNEETFLKNLSSEISTIETIYYRLENQEQREIWDAFTKRMNISKVTPITVIGDTYMVGFDNEKTSGNDIRRLIQKAQMSKAQTDIQNPNLQEAGLKTSTCEENSLTPCEANPKPSYNVTLPFLGKIDAGDYPLFFLSAMLGFFDGFNPCAMWVLVTFLIILIEVGNRKKMFIFAGTFILAEAIMYTFILTAWYKTWDFVRLDTIVTPIVGLVSIIGGALFLKEWRKKELECKVTDLQKRADTKSKIQKLATDKFTIVTFFGILGIAFSVNIIEFACSIGIPQAFTKILEINALSTLQWASMIATYIFFYMVDDFIVFGLAFWGADHLGLTTKYSKLSNLIGGIVMIILGFILIFKSQLLFF